MKFFILITLFQVTTAFLSRSLNTQRVHASKVLRVSTASPTEHKSGLQELIAMILEAIPLAINTPPSEMDKSKVIDNPPRFYKVRLFI